MEQTITNPLTQKRSHIRDLQQVLDEKTTQLENQIKELNKKLQTVSQTATELEKVGDMLQNIAIAQAKSLQQLETQEVEINQLTGHFSGQLTELEDIEQGLSSLVLWFAKRGEVLEQKPSESIPSMMSPSP